MKNQLSKREYKYRCKIIAENHLKKECQAYLDSYIAEKGFTYKDIYLDELTRLSWLTAYRFNQFGKAVYKAGISTSQFIDTMQNFAQTIKPWLEDDIDEKELKPCPFCGGTNIDCEDAGHKTDVWFVQCDDCGATFPHFDSEQEAIDAWNMRCNK